MRLYLPYLAALLACAGHALAQGEGHYSIALEARFEQGRDQAILLVRGETNYPERTVVVVSAFASARRLHVVPADPLARGRFKVSKGKLEAVLKIPEGALQPGVYDLVAEVDPLVQYPEVKQALGTIDTSRSVSRARFGTGVDLLRAMRSTAARTAAAMAGAGKMFAQLRQMEEEIEGKRAPEFTARWPEWREGYRAQIEKFIHDVESLAEIPWFAESAAACLVNVKDFLIVEGYRFAFRTPGSTSYPTEGPGKPITLEQIGQNLERMRSTATLELLLTFLNYFDFVHSDLTLISEASAEIAAKRAELARVSAEWGLGSEDFEALRRALAQECQVPEALQASIEELRSRFQALSDAVRQSLEVQGADLDLLLDAVRQDYQRAVSGAEEQLPE